MPFNGGRRFSFREAEGFFSESFGAGVEAAIVLAEGKIGRICFREPKALTIAAESLIAGKDTTGRDVTPREAEFEACLSEETGKNGVALKALGFLVFAGIDIGFTSEPGAVD
jgi:hypothetical protein